MSQSSLRIELPGQGATGPKKERRTLRGRLARWTLAGALVLAALVLPFALLVRLSVLSYQRWGVGGWTSLGLSSVAVFLLLLAYVVLVRFRVQRKLGVPRSVRRGLLVVVAAYVAYAALYLSGANAKTPDIREAYSALHPVLRVATGTVLLADRDAMVTDVGRTREDYLAWGLPVNEASLHFAQPDGYVHAVDLRTVGRPEWRNRSLEGYYRLMGFRTLRHVGTADHLHVSVPAR